MRAWQGAWFAVFAAMSDAALAQSAPVTECDALAGFASLPRLDDLPGAHVIADPRSAIAACETAVQAHPDDGWLRVLLARAMVVENPYDPRPVRVLTEAIETAPALAHAQLAMLFEWGLAGIPADETTARTYYLRGCGDGGLPLNAPACAGLGVMLIEGRGGAADSDSGFDLLAGACDQGWGPACVDLALQGELRGDNDPVHVAALLDAACEAGDLLGCSLLGFRHELGEGVALDLTRARALYQRACEGGEPEGCSNLGEVYRSGLGVPQDIPQAIRLFGIGCDGLDAFACMALGFVLADGRGVTADPDAAFAAFEQACTLGDPEGCDMMDALR